MPVATLLQETQSLLDDSLLVGTDADSKVRYLVEAEYLRRLAYYRRVDQALTLKYRVGFDVFLSSNATAQQGHSWDVEKDAMDWETAVDGIATMKRKLQELQTSVEVSCPY